ncbi:hypothetical protein DSO57_1006511 [Entomophthora muscae]|uniref:Uncharacterized protein n=1 Tax=Entomophthora muscae TaxID=34485 RepID=A0ACC2S9G1_9FUNG|nr:hypothetical protein DSO57_1006511 [Entomophthora muscae]
MHDTPTSHANIRKNHVNPTFDQPGTLGIHPDLVTNHQPLSVATFPDSKPTIHIPLHKNQLVPTPQG